MDTGYQIRLCDVVSTRWRAGRKIKPENEFDLTEHFKSFYDAFDEVPTLLAQALYEPDAVTIKPAAGRDEAGPMSHFDRVEVVLFSLPFPADQIVATVVLDFSCGELSEEPGSFVRQMLTASVESRVLIDGRPVAEIVDELAIGVHAEREKAADPDENPANGGRERHVLVMVQGNRDRTPDDEVITGILYGIRQPYRQEFVELERPNALNREGMALAVVTQSSSFLYGQVKVVENSVLLTTVQAVGTAARFQRIWHDAYYQVRQFQTNRLARKAGEQTRKDLETLADELGNLELDLAFSVQTAADLGLGSTIAQVDDFHSALHDVMQIKTRARTVGEMFVRLGGSLGSELTAIESREKEIDERYRLRAAITLGVLSFVVAPVSLVLGFFGINAAEIEERTSMFNMDEYLLVYVLAGGVLALALCTAAVGPVVMQWVRGRQRAESGKGVSS